MYKIFCPYHSEIHASYIRGMLKQVLDKLDKSYRPKRYKVCCPIRGCRKICEVIWLHPKFVFSEMWAKVKRAEGISLHLGELKEIPQSQVVEAMKHRENISTP